MFEGVEYALDVLVYATGFETSSTFTSRTGFEFDSVGGRQLGAEWEAGGMRTLWGIHSSGYPNLFILGGSQVGFPFNFVSLLDAQAVNAAAWAALFESYDFVLAPPAPTLAFEHRDGPYFWGAETIDGASRRAADGLAWAGLATFPNLPATVLPVGESGGLPCGMQVIGPVWADLDCIAAARGIGRILHG